MWRSLLQIFILFLSIDLFSIYRQYLYFNSYQQIDKSQKDESWLMKWGNGFEPVLEEICFRFKTDGGIILQVVIRQMQKKLKKLKWSPQELQLLQEIYPLYTSKRWKNIAGVFRHKGFSRTEIECRQKWINFLDPELNKGQWDECQLQRLYQIYDQVGTRWCLIQKQIGRTQNKIKNRFYGTLRNYIRFVVNFLQDSTKSYNYQIGKLSPKLLNDIYQAQNEFIFLNDEIKSSLTLMRFTVNRTFLGERISSKMGIYQKLKSIIFKNFDSHHKQTQEKESSELLSSSRYVVVKEEVSIQAEPSLVQIKDQPQQRPEYSLHLIEQQWPNPQFYYPFLNYPFHQYGLPPF